ncbi:hypothetical protein CFOL_v3_30199 [Cephalotus follicularis]|uniref:Uncharacterized protein n=1 Tax=Cephalotus follicularis TaxID=3775 RepID=A0A1Q3D399_CEPFO|nr:hypothetical protein CFOL_v3_30199 [Cephalotus follicularis]
MFCPYRIVRECKERRRLWAQNITPRQSGGGENVQGFVETETPKECLSTDGMLPSEIVKLLAAREKQVFLSDDEDEKVEVKPTSKKKKHKSSGLEPVILKDMPPPQCLQSSLQFLKKRKMQVPRSTAVLKNCNQALRLLSTSGVLRKN